MNWLRFGSWTWYDHEKGEGGSRRNESRSRNIAAAGLHHFWSVISGQAMRLKIIEGAVVIKYVSQGLGTPSKRCSRAQMACIVCELHA